MEAPQPAFVCGTIGRVFVLRWQADVSRTEMRRAFACMLEARREVGVPLVNISVIPANVDGPPRQNTEATESHFRIVDHLCDGIYTVLEGDGDSRKILRGMIAMQALAMQLEMAPCDSVTEAFARAAMHVGRDADELLAEARARGLVV